MRWPWELTLDLPLRAGVTLGRRAWCPPTMHARAGGGSPADGASLGSWEPVCPLVPVPVVLKSDEIVSLQLRTELTANSIKLKIILSFRPGMATVDTYFLICESNVKY